MATSPNSHGEPRETSTGVPHRRPCSRRSARPRVCRPGGIGDCTDMRGAPTHRNVPTEPPRHEPPQRRACRLRGLIRSIFAVCPRSPRAPLRRATRRCAHADAMVASTGGRGRIDAVPVGRRRPLDSAWRLRVDAHHPIRQGLAREAYCVSASLLAASYMTAGKSTPCSCSWGWHLGMMPVGTSSLKTSPPGPSPL